MRAAIPSVGSRGRGTVIRSAFGGRALPTARADMAQQTQVRRLVCSHHTWSRASASQWSPHCYAGCPQHNRRDARMLSSIFEHRSWRIRVHAISARIFGGDETQSTMWSDHFGAISHARVFDSHLWSLEKLSATPCPVDTARQVAASVATARWSGITRFRGHRTNQVAAPRDWFGVRSGANAAIHQHPVWAGRSRREAPIRVGTGRC